MMFFFYIFLSRLSRFFGAFLPLLGSRDMQQKVEAAENYSVCI